MSSSTELTQNHNENTKNSVEESLINNKNDKNASENKKFVQENPELILNTGVNTDKSNKIEILKPENIELQEKEDANLKIEPKQSNNNYPPLEKSHQHPNSTTFNNTKFQPTNNPNSQPQAQIQPHPNSFPTQNYRQQPQYYPTNQQPHIPLNHTFIDPNTKVPTHLPTPNTNTTQPQFNFPNPKFQYTHNPPHITKNFNLINTFSSSNFPNFPLGLLPPLPPPSSFTQPQPLLSQTQPQPILSQHTVNQNLIDTYTRKPNPNFIPIVSGEQTKYQTNDGYDYYHNSRTNETCQVRPKQFIDKIENISFGNEKNVGNEKNKNGENENSELDQVVYTDDFKKRDFYLNLKTGCLTYVKPVELRDKCDQPKDKQNFNLKENGNENGIRDNNEKVSQIIQSESDVISSIIMEANTQKSNASIKTQDSDKPVDSLSNIADITNINNTDVNADTTGSSPIEQLPDTKEKAEPDTKKANTKKSETEYSKPVQPAVLRNFKQMLSEKNVQYDADQSSILNLIIVDPRYAAMPTLKSRKKAQTEQKNEIQKVQKSERREMREKKADMFWEMLKECRMVTSQSRYSDIEALLKSDKRFKDVPDERERKQLSHQFVKALEKRQKSLKMKRLRSAILEYEKLLKESREITAKSRFHNFTDAFENESCFKKLDLKTRKRLFKKRIQFLREQSELRQVGCNLEAAKAQQNESRARQQRQQKLSENFRQLLDQALLDQNLFDLKATQKEVSDVDEVVQDSRYIEIISTGQHKQVQAIFEHQIFDLKEILKSVKRKVKLVIRSRDIDIFPDSNIELLIKEEKIISDPLLNSVDKRYLKYILYQMICKEKSKENFENKDDVISESECSDSNSEKHLNIKKEIDEDEDEERKSHNKLFINRKKARYHSRSNENSSIDEKVSNFSNLDGTQNIVFDKDKCHKNSDKVRKRRSQHKKLDCSGDSDKDSSGEISSSDGNQSGNSFSNTHNFNDSPPPPQSPASTIRHSSETESYENVDLKKSSKKRAKLRSQHQDSKKII